MQIDRLDDLGKQLSRSTDKRNSLRIFVAARGLPDEHQVGVGIPDAVHDIRSGRMELATRAGAKLRAQVLEMNAGT